MDVTKDEEATLPPSYTDIFNSPSPQQSPSHNEPYNPYNGLAQPIGLDKVLNSNNTNNNPNQPKSPKPIDLVTPGAANLNASNSPYGSHGTSSVLDSSLNPYDDDYKYKIDGTDDSKGQNKTFDDHSADKTPSSPQFQNLNKIQTDLQSKKLNTLHDQDEINSINTSPSELHLVDFWYPCAFVQDPELRNPCTYILMASLLPISFFAWLWFQIATISRLSPGGTPHSGDVPKFLLRNIYNEQAEINHILGLSEGMANHADHYFVKNQADLNARAKLSSKNSSSKSSETSNLTLSSLKPTAPITTSTTQYSSSLATGNTSGTDRKQRNSCCDCGGKSQQKLNNGANIVANLHSSLSSFPPSSSSTQSIEALQSGLLNRLQKNDYQPELYREKDDDNKNNNNGSSMKYSPVLKASHEMTNFPSLSLSVAWLMEGLTVDRVKRDYLNKNFQLFKNTNHVVIDYSPPKTDNPFLGTQTQAKPTPGKDGNVWYIDSNTGKSSNIFDEVKGKPLDNDPDLLCLPIKSRPTYHSLSTSLPFRHSNGQIIPSHNILPIDIMKMWQEDELRYSFWVWNLFLTILKFFIVLIAHFNHSAILKATLYLSLFATIIFVSQFISRRRYVKHALILTIDQIIAFPIGIYLCSLIVMFLQSIIQWSIWFAFAYSMYSMRQFILKLRSKPRRQLEYEHHIMVVNNYLQEQMRRGTKQVLLEDTKDKKKP